MVQLRVLASKPSPELMRLPWDLPLEQWGQEHMVSLPRGISRHVVRFVKVGDYTCAVKETDELIARREYHLLRDLQKLGLPTVVPRAVVTGRKDRQGEWLACALVTQHLRFSLPFRSLFARGMRADSLPALVDALVVLLVRLHLAGFYWGDVSLSNALFRRSAGGLSAYLVDAETGELHPALSERQRIYDLTVGRENVYAELMDLQAGELLDPHLDPGDVTDLLEQRYEALWETLTGAQEFGIDEMWRIDQWVERLNDLGFDVDEMDLVTEAEGSRVRIQPRVVELGHHSRELRTLTGLDVEEAQARRMLNDIARYAAGQELGRDEREVAANRWLSEVYEPLIAMVPRELRGRLEPAEIFHEVLVHRWYLSEQAGGEVELFDTARDYIENVLTQKPEEALATVTTGELRAVGLENDEEPEEGDGSRTAGR